jgi:hypothetical protein
MSVFLGHFRHPFTTHVNQTLLLEAEKKLRSSAITLWDNLFEDFKKIHPVPDVEQIWKTALSSIRKKNLNKFYRYVSTGGKFSGTTKEELDNEKNSIILTEIDKWDALIKIKRVERIANTVVFLTENNATFEVEGKDLFNQKPFRQACWEGVNVKLPEISHQAFEAFTDRLKYEVVSDFSISKKLVVQSMLLEMADDLKSNPIDHENEKDAINFAVRKGCALWGTFLFFKLDALAMRFRRAGRPFSQPIILVSLNQLNAKRGRSTDANYWIYDIEHIDEEIEEAEQKIEKSYEGEPENNLGGDSADVPF